MRILIFTINPLHNSPRVIREIDALKKNHELIVTGITPPHDESISYIEAKKYIHTHLEYSLGKLFRIFSFGKVFKGRYFTLKSKINRLVKRTDPDLVIVHPGAYLPYFFTEDRRYKVIFNAHEFHPKEFESDRRWKMTWGVIHDFIYRNYLPKVDLLINVCEGIAKECELTYDKTSIVIPNAGKYHPEIKPVHRFSGKIRMIHHGVAIKSRKLELMIEVAGQLNEKFELDMMLVYQDEIYYNYLNELSNKYDNVRIISPVIFHDIVNHIHQYDMGFFLLSPDNFNYRYALPNKLFEFIQARLAIAVGPSPEMAQIVRKYNLGVVSQDFSVSSMVESLKKLTVDDINKFKNSADVAAAVLHADMYDKILLDNLRTLPN